MKREYRLRKREGERWIKFSYFGEENKQQNIFITDQNSDITLYS